MSTLPPILIGTRRPAGSSEVGNSPGGSPQSRHQGRTSQQLQWAAPNTVVTMTTVETQNVQDSSVDNFKITSEFL